MGSVLCQITYRLLHFSHMERPVISKSQCFLAVCKCSRLCVNFGVGTFRVRTYFWPNLNPPLEHLIKVVLKCMIKGENLDCKMLSVMMRHLNISNVFWNRISLDLIVNLFCPFNFEETIHCRRKEIVSGGGEHDKEKFVELLYFLRLQKQFLEK